MSVFTLHVNQYSVKFSKNDDVINVSLPGYRFIVDDKISDADKTVLRECLWSDKMITALETHLLHGDWKNKNNLKLIRNGVIR